MKKTRRRNSIDLLSLIKKDDLYYDPDNKLYTGYYHWQYASGSIAEEGYMKNGQACGVIRLYNEEGKILVEAEYLDGKKNGLTTTYYPSGHIKAEFYLKNELREGRMRIWYEGGVKKFEAYYRNDMLNGKQIKYFPDGRVNVECEYKDNLEHGNKTVMKEDGTVLFKGYFEEGELR